MLNEKIATMINTQLNRELESAYIYQAMELYFASHNLAGFQNFFHVQVQEELAHSHLFIDYLNRLGGKVELEAISKPNQTFDSVLEVFEAALAHERTVTGWIYELMGEAIDARDFSTQSYLKWFVDEQTEEEETFTGIVDKLKFIKGDPHAILLLDNELAARTFVQPVI